MSNIPVSDVLSEITAAESQLTDAQRCGDAVAVSVAQFAVDAAEERAAAAVLELLLHAVQRHSEFLTRLVNRLPLTDELAREGLAALERRVADMTEHVRRLRQENWELGRTIAKLEARIERREFAREVRACR